MSVGHVNNAKWTPSLSTECPFRYIIGCISSSVELVYLCHIILVSLLT